MSTHTIANTLTQSSSANWLLRISMGVIFLAMTIMSFSYGISGDEVDMNEYGKTILQYFASFGEDKSVFRTSDELNAAGVYNYNRDNVVQYYGGLFDLLAALVNKISPLEEYTSRHLLNAWVGFFGIFFAVGITRRFLHANAGILVAWLMFLSPFFLGHAMNNPKDIPFASTYIMAIYFIIRLFDRMPKPSKSDYLWVILSIGAAINIRVGGILLIPYLGVYVAILYVVKNIIQKDKVDIAVYIKPILITTVLGYLCGSLLWPYGLQNPFTNPLTALSEMGNFKVNIKQIYEGEKVFSADLPSTYLLKSLFITNTWAVLMGILLMIVFAWNFRKSISAPVLYFVLFASVFPLFYIIYTKANVYHAWRHILFIFPGIAILAGFGWQQAMHTLARFKSDKIALGFMGLLLLDPLYFTATTFPHTVTYHNQSVGGVQGAYGQYEVDYYYNSVKAAAEWFKQHELQNTRPNDTIRLYSNAAHILTHYFKDNPNVLVDYIRFPERNQKKWDYALFHIALIPLEEIKSGSWITGTVIHQVAVQGKPLCILLKRPSFDDLKAYEFLNQNQADSALYYFEQYVKKDANNTAILNTIGSIQMQLGQIEKASQAIQQSYQLDATNMETKNLYAVLKLQQGDFATSQQLFAEILRDNPQYIRAYYYLAMAQAGAGNFQQALSNFNTASQDESLRRNCYQAMADIYAKTGQVQKAQELLRAAGIQ